MPGVGGEAVVSAEVDTQAGVYEVPLGTDAALGIRRVGFPFASPRDSVRCVAVHVRELQCREAQRWA